MINETDDLAQSTLCYGKNAVTELLKGGNGVDTVYIQDTMNPAQASYYTALAKEVGAVIKRVHPAKLRSMCQTESHQGVAAYAASVEYKTIDEILAIAKAKGESPFLVLCDGVEDPHNLGAIIRSALLCGVHGIVVPKRGGAAVTPIVLKTSAGAAATLPIARVANIGETIRKLKEQNVFVYSADMKGQPLHKHNLSGAMALVVGGEGSGVSRLVGELCDGGISLPMANTSTSVDSFNVSVACGVILYEIMRQRTI